jgi:beta-galactosidase GanA
MKRYGFMGRACLGGVGLAAVLVASLSAAQGPARPAAPAGAAPMPRVVEKDGRWALMVDGAPYLMLGMQVNNSSAWPAMLPEVWPAVDRLHANTVEMPVYWEQLEPVQGKFDFSVVDALLAGAREHKLHLVLLWFGTWKNGAMHYTPEWVKRDPAKYPRVTGQDKVAENGAVVHGAPGDTMSPFATATMEADKAAFSALMRHLKTADPRHTVLMIQVENEINAYGSRRDYSPEATKLFEGQVPADFAAAMKVNPGTWTEAFGAEAENTFQTWSIARYVEQVAKAGKAEYGIPLYLNHSLEDPLRAPREGRLAWPAMTDHVLDIWKATAPSLDLIAPDIYMSQYAQYEKVLDVYARAGDKSNGGNAMFVPESGNAAPYPRYFFAALGHGTIGWSPFGLDLTGYANAPLGAPSVDNNLIDLFALNYEIVGPMQREIARLNFEGKLQAVCEDPATRTPQTMVFGPWTASVSYGLRQFGGNFPGATPPAPNPNPTGRALVAQLGPDEFLVTGASSRVDFRPTDAAGGKRRAWVRVEEGSYVDGKWKFRRIWNGDQTDYGLNFTTAPQVLRVTLMAY